MSGLKTFICVGFVSFTLFSHQCFAAQLSISTEVKDNIKTLKESRSCPKCDLRGANLNRSDLSGVNLEGANLSRASFALSNLSGANLQGTDLRETVFNGADLANADMRGADLTGVSFVGAYMKGALLDGEMVTTQPYAEHEEISEVVENVYVEDTVKPKVSKEPEEISIGSRRDFEESPPTVPEVVIATDVPVAPKVDTVVTSDPSPTIEPELAMAAEEVSIPQQSAAAPEVKAAPSIKEVNIEELKPAVLEQATVVKPEEVPSSVEQTVSNKEDEGTEVNTANSLSQGEESAKDVMETEEEATGISEKEREDSKSPEQEDNKESLGMMDSAVEMVQGMFGGGGEGRPPQTETAKNVYILLDINQCYSCNLDGAILTGEDLEDADLEGASLKGAKLSGVDLQNANLKGADLSDADLSGADLSGADLYRAILTGADLSNATLDDTKLDEADLSQVKGYQEQNLMIMQ